MPGLLVAGQCPCWDVLLLSLLPAAGPPREGVTSREGECWEVEEAGPRVPELSTGCQCQGGEGPLDTHSLAAPALCPSGTTIGTGWAGEWEGGRLEGGVQRSMWKGRLVDLWHWHSGSVRTDLKHCPSAVT